jgi:anti-sigma factor RsiW
MAKCRDVEALFASYVDGESAPQDRATVDSHLTACPPCRDRIAEERAARDLVITRREHLRAAAPQPLRHRCAAYAASAAGRPPSRLAILKRRPWVPLSLAATLLLAVGGVFLFGINDNVHALATQLALDHVKCFQFPPSHAPGDAAAVSREWAGAQGWAIQVPSTAASEQLELIGVRRCLSTEGRVAHLMYRWRGEPLSVYVLNSGLKGMGEGVPATEEMIPKLGEEAIMWSKAGRTYAVVGRARPADLQHIAAYVRRTAE